MKQLLAFLLIFQLLTSPVFAAIAYVTSSSGGDMSGGSAATIATDAAALGSGALVAVCVRWFTNVTITSVTDTAGNTYADSGAGRIAIPAASGYTQLFYTYNATANASNVVTANFSAGSTYRVIAQASYSGAKTTDPKDVGNTGTATNATSVTSGSFTPSESGEVAVACVGRNGTTTATTPDANYTQRQERAPAVPSYVLQLADRLSAPVSAQTASASANSDWWAIIAYTFKAAGSSRRPIAPIMLGE